MFSLLEVAVDEYSGVEDVDGAVVVEVAVEVIILIYNIWNFVWHLLQL